jgi:large subunit ribosomal protein L22
MEVNAKLSFIRITPRKLGLLADEVRGKDVGEALAYLRFSPRKRAAKYLYELLKSAASNAHHQATIDVDTLYVKTILVGKANSFKRLQTRAKGSGHRIIKRNAHVRVVLAER